MRVNGPITAQQRLPNTLSISIKDLRADELLARLSDELAASAGAACHSHQQATVSSVLQAMQVKPRVYHSAEIETVIMCHGDTKITAMTASVITVTGIVVYCKLHMVYTTCSLQHKQCAHSVHSNESNIKKCDRDTIVTMHASQC